MLIGPYRVLRVLARGGMGEVCLASLERAGGFRKLVALKRALPEFAADPAFREMFRREARLAAALNHRNIVQVFDFDHHGDEAWIAMEYVRGLDLKAVLDAQRLPTGLAVNIGLAVARGLDYVHRATDPSGQPLNLVHQDVSPANVLLSFEGDIKLSDFGVAWQSDASVRGLQGKLGYMSPEVVQGVPLDARGDQFALGIVLYEMLSGQRAFWSNDGTEAILARVGRATPIQPLAVAAPHLEPELVAVVERAMAQAPDRRFADVAALADALEAAAVGVDRTVALGSWLAERFEDVDAAPSSPPLEVTAAAVAPIAVAEGTLAAGVPIQGEAPTPPRPETVPATPAALTPRQPASGRPIVIVLISAVLIAAGLVAFWPDDSLTGDVRVSDAQVQDAQVADARVRDASPQPPLARDAGVDRVVDARVVDATPPPVDAAPPPSRAPRTARPRAPRTARPRAPKTRRPRRVTPRSIASAAPKSAAVAPITQAPQSVAPATTPKLTGPRIRLSSGGATLRGAQSLGGGWHRVAGNGVLVRVSGPGPAITVRLKPQGGRFVATVSSKPFGPLQVDGRALGSTPAASVPLAPGRHVLLVGAEGSRSRLALEVR